MDWKRVATVAVGTVAGQILLMAAIGLMGYASQTEIAAEISQSTSDETRTV